MSKYDVDKNGVIDREEYKQIVRHTQAGYCNEKVFKVFLGSSRLYPPNEGSLAGCEPTVRFKSRTHVGCEGG